MRPSHEKWLTRLLAADGNSGARTRRGNSAASTSCERNIVLPVKAVFIAMIWYSFDIKPWFGTLASTLEVVRGNGAEYFPFLRPDQLDRGACILLLAERLPLAVLQWTVVAERIGGRPFYCGLALISGGLDSILFWLFVALIIRNAVSIPPGDFPIDFECLQPACVTRWWACSTCRWCSNLDDSTLRSARTSSPHEDAGAAVRAADAWCSGC